MAAWPAAADCAASAAAVGGSDRAPPAAPAQCHPALLQGARVVVARHALMAVAVEPWQSELIAEHAATGFGPKGDKQCEYAELFDGMRLNNLDI